MLLLGKLLRMLQKIYYFNIKKYKEKANKLNINVGTKMYD